MTEASSSGHAAQPKIKSINVEANLLAQRLQDLQRLQGACRRKLMALVGLTVGGLLLLPWLYGISNEGSARSVKLEKQLATLKAEVTKMREASKLAQPLIDSTDMLRQCRGYASGFLREFVLILNSTPPQMAIAGIKGDVLGGDMTVTARADAEDFRSAEAFLNAARQGAAPENVGFTATRRSDVLKVGGISFEFFRKSQVTGS